MLTDLDTVRNSLLEHGRHAKLPHTLQAVGRDGAAASVSLLLEHSRSCCLTCIQVSWCSGCPFLCRIARAHQMHVKGFLIQGYQSINDERAISNQGNGTPALPSTSTTRTSLGLSQPLEAHLICRASNRCMEANFTEPDACARVRSIAALPVRRPVRSCWPVYCTNGQAYLCAAHLILCANIRLPCQSITKRLDAWVSQMRTLT
jgi:hypothetical protein